MGIIFIIERIRSSLIHGIYLLGLLLYLIEVTSLVFTNRTDLLCQKPSLGSPVNIAKGLLMLLK